MDLQATSFRLLRCRFSWRCTSRPRVLHNCFDSEFLVSRETIFRRPALRLRTGNVFQCWVRSHVSHISLNLPIKRNVLFCDYRSWASILARPFCISGRRRCKINATVRGSSNTVRLENYCLGHSPWVRVQKDSYGPKNSLSIFLISRSNLTAKSEHKIRNKAVDS